MSRLPRAAATQLACLIALNGAPGCSILFPFEPDEAASAEPDAALDAAVDAALDATVDAALDAANDADIDAGCDPDSGVYSLESDEAEPLPGPFYAYCDMDTDGGGWTLVGRSVPDASAGGFG
jgi:hypothetical protein